MPLQVGSFPENLPDVAGLHVASFGDGLFDVLRRIGKERPDEKEFDLLAFDALTFPDLVAQMQRGPVFRPNQFLNQVNVVSNLIWGKSHGSVFSKV